MSIDTALRSAMATIPGCVAAGYIDMGTGMLLGQQGSAPENTEALETLAIAAANLFQGRGIGAFERLLKEAGKSDPDSPGFGEIAVFSNDRVHLFLRTAEHPDHVVCYICEDCTNVGLALTKSHMSLKQVAATV